MQMTKRAVDRVVALSGAPLALWLMASCAMDDDLGEPADEAAPEAANEIEQGLTTLVVEDFENDGTQLRSPWSQTPAAGFTDTRAVIQSSAGHGNVLDLQGSEEYGQYLIAYLPITAPSDVVASVDINPDAGASFVWSLWGQGTGTYKRRVRLQRWPDSPALVATANPSGDTACGSLPSGRWTNVALVMHVQRSPHTFDVLINGAPTSCTGLEVVTNPPFNRVEVMDASNESWGGDTQFDNIRVARP
jgi:hypothetical protein